MMNFKLGEEQTEKGGGGRRASLSVGKPVKPMCVVAETVPVLVAGP